MASLAQLLNARKVQNNGGSPNVKKPSQKNLDKMKAQYENDIKFIDYMVSNPNGNVDDFRLNNGLKNSHHGYSPSVTYFGGNFYIGIQYGLNLSCFMKAEGVSTADDVVAYCDLKRAKDVADEYARKCASLDKEDWPAEPDIQELDPTEAKKLYAMFIEDIDNRIQKTGDQDETKICTEWFKTISAR
ncbi:hypothetical protein [Acetobacter pasteurianus]|uniref:Uncharacterized protein n=1 Tax=Acetobacter pasteurianus subsp. pasteurianus TaxID=481145 RepID=A0A1Y0Y550_ACEPA|nr:hypothetical protein [Acetobacter pasteurianus]ARW49502.1 hypothetical protein S1001342_03212 [Acetobacter pasteurianus subsp. pasteurianus]